jgi:hypothetical protein
MRNKVGRIRREKPSSCSAVGRGPCSTFLPIDTPLQSLTRSSDHNRFTPTAFMLHTCWYACIVYLCARRALRPFKQFILVFFSDRACKLSLPMLIIPSMWSCCFWQEREERRKRLKREQQDDGSRLHSQQIRVDYAPQPKRHSRIKEAPQGTKYWAIF